jgi:4-hydroxy-tetrahydrodipicolinate synthase
MLHGSLVALVTPMLENGEIDYPALQGLIDWHIQENTDAIVVLGSTGEAATLTFKEREQILTQTVKHVDGRVPVIVGTGTNCTTQTVDLTRQAALLGADAALVVTPYYNRPTQRGLIAHFEAVLDADLPIILYNVPSRTSVDMQPETVLTLAKHEKIIGIKEASTLERIMTLLETAPEPFLIYSGDDINGLEAVKAGAAGVVTVAGNLVPGALHAMLTAARAGDLRHAQSIHNRLLPLFQGIFVETNPIPVKWALKEMGKIQSGIRLPLQELAVQYQASLSAILKAEHLI